MMDHAMRLTIHNLEMTMTAEGTYNEGGESRCTVVEV